MNDPINLPDGTTQDQVTPNEVKLLVNNTTVLANIVDLTTNVVISMSKNDMKNNLGSVASREVIGNLIGNVIREELKLK